MKRVILAGVSALAVVMMMSGANAADLPRRHAEMPVKAPAYVAAYNWTGLYAGINGGGGFGRSNWSALGTDFNTSGGMVGAAAARQLDVLFLLGADDLNMNGLAETFVVYIGTHGDAGAHRADVILPGAAYTEKSGTYVNTEGRVQVTARAAFPPGDAREDWAILRALSEMLGKVLPFDTLTELRAGLYRAFPHLQRIGAVEPGTLDQVTQLAGKDAKAANYAYGNRIGDFYLTNPIARASAIMAECSALAAGRPAVAAE